MQNYVIQAYPIFRKNTYIRKHFFADLLLSYMQQEPTYDKPYHSCAIKLPA